MAWLYLILVIIVFYSPVVGLGPRLLDADVSLFSTPIPFSGSFRLLLFSFLVWAALWRGTLLLEERTGFDLLYWLDEKLKLDLRQRWLYADRMSLSGHMAEKLARLGLGLILSWGSLIVFLAVALAVILPWLFESAIPSIAVFLSAHFPEAQWAEAFARWLSSPFADWLIEVLADRMRDLLADLMDIEIHASLLHLSILILCAARARRAERQYRVRLDLERNRVWRKRAQKDLVIP